MFEHFDERARICVTLAQEEARRLGHEEVGTVHLLLGVTGAAPELLELPIETVRAAVVALNGSGPAPTSGMMPFSSDATAAVTGANAQALALGHTTIDAAHLLLALLDAGGGGARALREAGAIPGEVRERATAAAGIGALGNPSADAQLLRLMLVNDTVAARLLRDHGIDEARLNAVFGPLGSG
jgi:ATP-dependent Clp protease ATP-binding subunit ClpA